MSRDIRTINDDLDTLRRSPVLDKALRDSLNDASRLVTELRMAMSLDPTTSFDDVLKVLWGWEKIMATRTTNKESADEAH